MARNVIGWAFILGVVLLGAAIFGYLGPASYQADWAESFLGGLKVGGVLFLTAILIVVWMEWRERRRARGARYHRRQP
jgi:hypothetical protein